MLKNAYFLAKIGADTAENEQRFAEILPKLDPDGPPLPRAGAVMELVAAGDEAADPLAELARLREQARTFGFSAS